MRDAYKLKLTHSSVLNKQGKPFVSVMFERDGDCAEGSIPDCKITKNDGFSDKEVKELEEYLHNNGQDIIDKAKKISGFTNIFG